MAGQSVQFFGKEKVLQAYTARGIEVWGLFDKKQFINAGESSAELNAFLDMLEPGGSQSIYTLKVYNNVDDIDELTDRTECNGSFNFKLFNTMAPASLPAAVGGVGNGGRYADPIYNKLQGVINEEVSNAIDKRLGGGDKDDSEEDWNSVIMGYVKEPDKLVTVINAIGAFLRPGQAAMGMPVALAGTDAPVRVGALPNNQDEKLQRLSIVLDRLEKADPDILSVLEKIADLAENNKPKYNMAKSLL